MGEKFKYVGKGTGGSGMNVLMIGLDSTLAMDKEKVIGDSQERHILYGKHISKLFIIVPSKKEQRLTVKRLSNNVIVYPTSSRRFLFVWDAYKICKRLCEENKIDVITTQDPLLTGLVGYLLKRKFNIPLNVQLHGNYLNDEFWLGESKLNYFLNFLGNFIVKRADSIRAVSKKVEKNIMLKVNISAEKLITFPVFINIDKFINSQKVNPRERFLEFENIILFVGALSKTKDVEALLIAAKNILNKYPKTLFLIVGDGQVRKELEELAQELKIEQNVKFEGAVSYENIPDYYLTCDLLILPSKHEGWGRVVIEALACGKPIIVSDACGVSELVISGECGLVFQVDRPDILAEKIIYLLDDPKLREEMGAKGRGYVIETQDIKKNAHKYRELYEKTVELAKRKKI